MIREENQQRIVSDPVFHSSLSLEEIENNFKSVDCFQDIMEGLQEALANEKPHPTQEDHSLVQKL